MAERKRWDKQDFHPPRGDSAAATADAKADPVLTKQLQYIKVLEERNRVKKRLAAASKRNDRLQEREEAFVTAFNVPARAAQSGSSTARNSRSATSVLPTKFLAPKPDEAKLTKCRSAPSTTLNFASASAGGEDKGAEQNRARRAKWNRPQAPMEVAVEHQDGVPLFRLTTQDEAAKSEEKGGEDELDEEESYLEESFEEFEEDEEEFGRQRQGAEEKAHVKELVIEEIGEDEEYGGDVKLTASRDNLHTSKTSNTTDDTVDLSKTTKELVGIIQHLSRSKQRALMNVLQKFQASEQDENDVKVLQSSIGDPAIWKEITCTLNNSPSGSAASGAAEGAGNISNRDTPISTFDHPTITPLKNLLEEQLQWEDEYANQVKERLAREREEKQRILKEAEERRAKMMQQLEDEEHEIERLMEAKRRERIAKLRALQDDGDITGCDQARTQEAKPLVNSTISANSENRSIPIFKVESKEEQQLRKLPEGDGASFFADAKEISLKASDKDDMQGCGNLPGAPRVPVVPRLNLSDVNPIKRKEGCEIVVKLLSTWSKTRAVGLTQICVYDSNGEELPVNLDTLRLYDQLSGRPLPQSNDMVRGMHKLFNGVAQTNKENNMWLGRLGDSGVLLVSFMVFSTPSKLCVWNYNSKAHNASTRDIDVLVSGKCVWTGSLPETFGDEDDNICTWIDLLNTARKTTRTVCLESSSIVSADVKELSRSHTLPPERWVNTETDGSQPTKASAPTPMWLSGPCASSSSLDRVSMSSRSSSDDTWGADEKPLSGGITSRRRQGKALYSAQKSITDAKVASHVTLPDRADSKPFLRQKNEAKTQETQQHVMVPELSSLSSWDSLEKFSKTNRSRLPQPADISESTMSETDVSNGHAKVKLESSVSRTTFTTSALLTELRQGEVGSSFTFSPPVKFPGVLKTSPLERAIENDVSSVNYDVDSVNTAAVGDIPVLPSGKWLQIEILSTWGDPYYVGLNGVEIFNHLGELVQFQDPGRQVTACPESINVLEENTNDPRVPKNLIDGVNFTCDDFHMWLAPFTPGQSHYVLLEMDSSVLVSMVRIWNYNKSRTHTCRGVREARIILHNSDPTKQLRDSERSVGGEDGRRLIFEGEIRQAPGLVGSDSMELSNEVILFTQETTILDAIETNDEALRALAREQQREEEENRNIVATVHRTMELRRPRTSDSGSRTIERSPKNQEGDGNGWRHTRVGKDGRPMTTTTGLFTSHDPRSRISIDSWVNDEPQQRSPDATKVIEGVPDAVVKQNFDENLPRGRRLTLQLISSWGDRNYVGLTQVEVLVGARGTPIPLDVANIDATPRDLASLGYIGDPRTLDKLFDGEATTCDDTHMWLVPLESGTVPELRIELKTAQYFYGLRIWNYNKSPEDTYRGVKQLVVRLDGTIISPKETGYLLRKAPGVANFSFGQLLTFSDDDGTLEKVQTYSERVRYPFSTRGYKTPIIRQDYEAPLYPQGFLLKIVCWTTWGDPYYLGLNGIELYDFSGARITERPSIITAVPYSVSELDDSNGHKLDLRTPDNLVSGFDKNTWDADDSWLAPLASSLGNQQGNIIYIGFNIPVVLSMIKFWNYSKTPERGAKDVDIYLDDMHLFSGTLRKAPRSDLHGASNRLAKVHKVTEQFGQPILFSASQAQVDSEKRNAYYCGVEEQDVLCINEGQVMQESRAMYRKPDPGAEGVVVDLDLRPMTAVCRQ